VDNERDAIKRKDDTPVPLREGVKDLGYKVQWLDKDKRINNDPSTFDPEKLNISRTGKKGWRYIKPSEVKRYIDMRNQKG
jgi:hypothetical protein